MPMQDALTLRLVHQSETAQLLAILTAVWQSFHASQQQNHVNFNPPGESKVQLCVLILHPVYFLFFRICCRGFITASADSTIRFFDTRKKYRQAPHF